MFDFYKYFLSFHFKAGDYSTCAVNKEDNLSLGKKNVNSNVYLRSQFFFHKISYITRYCIMTNYILLSFEK